MTVAAQTCKFYKTSLKSIIELFLLHTFSPLCPPFINKTNFKNSECSRRTVMVEEQLNSLRKRCTFSLCYDSKRSCGCVYNKPRYREVIL